MHCLMKAFCTIPVFNKIRSLIQLEHRSLTRASRYKNLIMNSLFRILKRRGKVKTLLMCRINRIKLLRIKILLKLISILILKQILNILQIIIKKSINNYKNKIFKKNQ